MNTYDYANGEITGAIGSAWARFWARGFDTLIYALPTAFLVGLAFPSFFTGSLFTEPGGEYALGVLLLPLVMIVDALVIAITGTSPGKAIAGLSVRDSDNNNPSIELSLKRNLLLYIKGLVLGLPLFSLIGYISGYNAMKKNNATSWDESTGTRVYCSDGESSRTVLIAILFIALSLLANIANK